MLRDIQSSALRDEKRGAPLICTMGATLAHPMQSDHFRRRPSDPPLLEDVPMPKTKTPRAVRPRQRQNRQPGRQHLMRPSPRAEGEHYRASGQLEGKVALITGGDSGIGRAVAIAFAKEGANVAISYLEETKDAEKTKQLVEATGARCLLMKGDIGTEALCQRLVKKTVSTFGKLDIVINNAAEQHQLKDPGKISARQVEKTFRTNVFSAFHLLRHALPHLKKGACIINTASVVAYRGSSHLVDYSATKGALLAMTRSLASALAKRGIRVNAVAPGPIWTPLIASTFPADQVATFGSDTPMGRAGQPDEVAPAYVYLASDAGSYVSGQCLHVNGGEVVNG